MRYWAFTDAISELYEFTVPGHSKYDLTRTLHTLPSVTAFEALCNELAETPEFRFNFDPAELPPVYHEHRVVRDGAAAGVDVVPTALYVDGVPYTKTDGVIGWWLVNIASGRRHLLVVVRKRNTCKCGCRGWCTFFAVFDYLRWALAAMAEGSWPTSRHDGAQWKDSDANRSVFAGSPLGYRAAVIHIKCDWMEACATFGFPTWTHSLRPCLKCASPPSELHNIAGVSLDDFPFHVNTHDDYLSACGRCEVVVRVATAAARDAVAVKLFYDKKQGGSGGRAMTQNHEALGLLQGDRLEPGRGVTDVSLFETKQPPFDAVFWRPSRATVARHRNPLFSEDVGLEVTHMCVDSLHTIYLGVMLVFCRDLIWSLINADAWETGFTTAEERFVASDRFLSGWLVGVCRSAPRLAPARELDGARGLHAEDAGIIERVAGPQDQGRRNVVRLSLLRGARGREAGALGGRRTAVGGGRASAAALHRHQ